MARDCYFYHRSMLNLIEEHFVKLTEPGKRNQRLDEDRPKDWVTSNSMYSEDIHVVCL